MLKDSETTLITLLTVLFPTIPIEPISVNWEEAQQVVARRLGIWIYCEGMKMPDPGRSGYATIEWVVEVYGQNIRSHGELYPYVDILLDKGRQLMSETSRRYLMTNIESAVYNDHEYDIISYRVYYTCNVPLSSATCDVL